MSKFKKTRFNERWLLESKFSLWLKPVEKDNYAAYCMFCKTTFALSNMGKRAVTSHSEGKKHQVAVESSSRVLPLNRYFPTPEPLTKNQVPQNSTAVEEVDNNVAGTSSRAQNELHLVQHECASTANPGHNVLKKFVQMEEVL